MKPKVIEVSIDELVPDNLNANRGTEYGTHLLEKSFRELGAGRSLLLDKNNRIIAGNKSTETAAAIGLKNVIIVETDGTQLVAVKRTDIDLDSKQGRELAIADNATSKANLQWEPQAIAKIEEGWGVVPADWGIPDFDEPEEPEEDNEPTEISLTVQSDDPVALRLLSVELQERGFKCNLKE
ncbi:MAG: hypothetical protein BWY89_00010 [Bacteroidetes bacterium ADurb.BinA012]|jgi:hypothetical protein|nr:MAG: hypothetical protein BWY89_00010 [Bacteroidetes bacterium ADurb.BinA012]